MYKHDYNNKEKDLIVILENDLQQRQKLRDNLQFHNYKIIVVDNSSSNEFGNFIHRNYQNIIYLFTGGNIGYAGAYNQALKHIMLLGAEY